MTNFLGLEKNYIDGILCPHFCCWVCWWLKLLWLISSRLGWLKLLDITIYLSVLLIVNSEFWSKLLISLFVAYLGCLGLVGFLLSLDFLAPTPTQLHTSLLLELLVSLSINFCMSHVSNMVDDWCRWGSFISNVFGNDDWCRWWLSSLLDCCSVFGLCCSSSEVQMYFVNFWCCCLLPMFLLLVHCH